ncbi:helix-turn-helix domain-containing protein [Nocardiopsis exhalans]|uniref:Helix-turn-helix domain-containing protein n=1 Tax=Nocardiopsis exhalans TaxID=163604 RepID=A0ABY5CZ37_9ACTN|nr:helix-turn-helix domain-containing protein [Nocardiopsis exhalans]USY17086.1 helix-turn-helix domain-containing protein [Nocardiopsis exhalans]
MESNASTPSSTAETPNPAGFSAPRKRPKGALKGIGFILAIWVHQIFSKGLLTKPRSVLALMAIADAVDSDGRWCYFRLENLAKSIGWLLSLSSLKRAIDDLVEAGIVRKLTRSETIEFFAEDINQGRSAYQLPCVLELLVPAQDYPEPVLADINACRAQLGEEPLTVHNRPPLKRRPTPVHVEPAPRSDRPTDCSPGDCSESEVDSSVRDTSSTGEQTRQNPRSGIFSLINRIPNSFLASPETDRNLLALAVEKLLRQGLSETDVRALFAGMDRMRRPFPVLMLRLRNVRYALDFLNGSLGRGIHTSPLQTAPWPDPPDRDETSAQPKGFRLDSLGQATGTCPEHATTRNVPGGRCKICGGLCRSEPGQTMPKPQQGADTPARGGPESAPAPEPSGPPPGAEEDLDPELKAQMLDSLNDGGERVPTAQPDSKSTVRPARASGLSPRTRALLDQLHEKFKRSRRPDGTDTPKAALAQTHAGRAAPQAGPFTRADAPITGKIPLPRRPEALSAAMRASR